MLARVDDSHCQTSTIIQCKAMTMQSMQLLLSLQPMFCHSARQSIFFQMLSLSCVGRACTLLCPGVQPHGQMVDWSNKPTGLLWMIIRPSRMFVRVILHLWFTICCLILATIIFVYAANADSLLQHALQQSKALVHSVSLVVLVQLCFDNLMSTVVVPLAATMDVH